MINALSIDVEEWYQAELVRPHILDARVSASPNAGGDQSRKEPERRVAWAIEPILTLLERHNTRATFFVVGDVLRHQPDLVRRLYEAGHEIGCHGWSHRPLWELAPERFARDLEAFDGAIEDLGVMPIEEIVGFRAPTFSLDERSSWALGLLSDHGYRYDSSIFPLRTFLYGVEGSPPHPYSPTEDELTMDHIQASPAWPVNLAQTGQVGGDAPCDIRANAAPALVEFPMTVYDYAGIRVPVCGGFYLRALPLLVLRHLLGRVNARGHPFVLYLHPWEADEGTPRAEGLRLSERFITYYNTRAVIPKLEALLQRFQFAPLRDVLGVRSRHRRAGCDASVAP